MLPIAVITNYQVNQTNISNVLSYKAESQNSSMLTSLSQSASKAVFCVLEALGENLLLFPASRGYLLMAPSNIFKTSNIGLSISYVTISLVLSPLPPSSTFKDKLRVELQP